MPAASQRRHVGHGAVMFAVGPLGNRTAAEVKIRVPRIAARPAAGLWGERADLFGGGQAWVGEGGCLGGRHGGLFRRRRDEEGSGRLRFGAAVCPGGDSDGGLLDLGNRHRPAARRRSTMPTPQGTRRSPSCQRRTLRGPTPNSWATRCCAMPSASSVARNSVLATDEVARFRVNGHMMSLQIAGFQPRCDRHGGGPPRRCERRERA